MQSCEAEEALTRRETLIGRIQPVCLIMFGSSPITMTDMRTYTEQKTRQKTRNYIILHNSFIRMIVYVLIYIETLERIKRRCVI
jgi:hypothetical protein